MIGDPSGKSEERNLLSLEQLQHNLQCVERQMRQFLDFDSGPNSALLVNNVDWMGRFSYLDFLRQIGKHASLNVMLAKDSVKNRLDRADGGLSYTEFSYMLLQAYDFVHLARDYDCSVQLGGSDQWGNITAGIDLGRRMLSRTLHGLTCPLLTKSDGSKMGKTESGSIWLAPERTSPYAFYQYWINIADEDAGKCLRFLTDLPREEIELLDRCRETEPHKRGSQKRLAEHLTKLVHGDQGLNKARRATEVFFGAEISELRDADLQEIFADVSRVSISLAELRQGQLSLQEALVRAGLASSKSDARRSIQQGGVYVNNRRIENLELVLSNEHRASESMIVLRTGKKKFALLRVE
jgi:tyrosyl-tRNA synthetase